MSKLQLKPEFENVPAGETLRGVASSSDSAAAADAASSGSPGRGGRRRCPRLAWAQSPFGGGAGICGLLGGLSLDGHFLSPDLIEVFGMRRAKRSARQGLKRRTSPSVREW